LRSTNIVNNVPNSGTKNYLLLFTVPNLGI